MCGGVERSNKKPLGLKHETRALRGGAWWQAVSLVGKLEDTESLGFLGQALLPQASVFQSVNGILTADGPRGSFQL